MEHKLSVIMPCYNCSSTLEESVDSIFTQNLQIPFEVVLVDDGSTDDTKQVMSTLAKKHSGVRLFYHPKNLGGGTARNTAVKETAGDIIFCLDSDDIISPNTLPSMVDFMLEKKYDGVVFEHKKFFSNNIQTDRGGSSNIINSKKIVIDDLFEGTQGPLTLENFIYSKEAFIKADGYPTNHGFDTQGFGYRFLAKGLSVGVCPGSTYHQRIGSKKAYFASVYEKGELSKNMLLILSDIFFLFSKKTRKVIMNYDIFKNTKLGHKNLSSVLNKLYVSDPASFFIKQKEEFIKEGFVKFYEEFKGSREPEDIFCLGIYFYNQKDYKKSYECFETLKRMGLDSVPLSYMTLRSSLAMNQEGADVNFDSLTLKHFTLTKQKIYLNPNLVIKFLVKIKSFIRKILGKNLF